MMFACDEIGGRINYDGMSYSFCHFFEVGQQDLGFKGVLTPEIYDEEVQRIVQRNENINAPCRKCSRCKERKHLNKKIYFVTLNTSRYCNSNCVYCNSYGVEGDGINPIPSLELFRKENRFDKDCLFDWGGGEPTLNPFFEECVNWLSRHGFHQRINTNAIRFSEETYRALIEKKTSLRISVDAGSREVFYRVKGHNYYDDVWSNVKKYCEASSEVYLKYNIFNYNSDKSEADIFLDNCDEARVKHIYVEAEHFSYGQINNVGPLYFGDKELEFAHYLYNESIKRGFDTLIASGFADRSTHNKVVIPTILSSNLDEVISKGGIYCDTFATSLALIQEIGNRKVLIWGCGNIGEKVFDRINCFSNIGAMIDSNERLQGTLYRNGISIISPEKAYKMYPNAVIILASFNYADMLRIINKNKWESWKGNIYYLLPSKWNH